MTVNECIRKADTLRPNAIDDQHKADVLYNLETDLADMMGLVQDVKKPYEESDPELLMPDPWSEFYVYYVMAMIDEINEDTQLYANDMTMANDLQSKARRWWQRTHVPRQKKGVNWY